jgi:hypothetical protein
VLDPDIETLLRERLEWLYSPARSGRVRTNSRGATGSAAAMRGRETTTCAPQLGWLSASRPIHIV